MDRINSIEAFVKVVEHGSFSAAARCLNLSTTMVSKHVQALESRLGARLLNRTTRKVHLTEIGQTYYQGCTRLLSSFEEIDDIARAQQTTPSGKLRINTIPSAGIVLLPSLIADFVAQYPNIAVEMVISEKSLHAAEDGFDVALRIEDYLPPSFIVKKLTDVVYVVCGASSYLKQHGTPETPEDLVRHNCLTFDNSLYYDGWEFNDRRGRPHNVKVSGNLHTNNIVALANAAARGQGLTVVPTFLLEDPGFRNRLVPLLPDFVMPNRTLKAVYPSNRHVSTKVRVFIEFLVKTFAARRSGDTPSAPRPLKVAAS